MPKYAENTTVSSELSRLEIEKRHCCDMERMDLCMQYQMTKP